VARALRRQPGRPARPANAEVPSRIANGIKCSRLMLLRDASSTTVRRRGVSVR
jgi:hypothetical protein